MLADLLIYGITVICQAVFGAWAVLIPSSWSTLPDGVLSMFTALGDFIGTASVILPDGFLANLAAATAVIFSVQLFVLPWIAARNFRLPFAALAKKE